MDGDDSDLPVIPARGRARSHSMHEAFQPDLAAEIAAASGVPVSQGRGEPTGVPSMDSSSRSGAGKLSKKTLSMLTDLAAVGGATEMEHVEERILTEEELAERELSGTVVTKSAVAGTGNRARIRGAEGGEHDVLVKLLLLGDGGVGEGWEVDTAWPCSS
jgi:hypothetical protein